jgi:hypothetical protein
MIGFPPVAPTPPPGGQDLCQESTISRNFLLPGQDLDLRLFANEPVSGFRINFYNNDNLNGDGTPKPIYFEDGIAYSQSYQASPPTTDHIFTITYDEVNRPDLNPDWNGTPPRSIQIKGYFYDADGNLSAEDSNCNETFVVAVVGACDTRSTHCFCTCNPGEFPDPSSTCFSSNPPQCSQGTCNCIPYTYPPGMILYYSLNEGSGTVANDSSGYGLNGTLANSSLWTVGACSNAVYSPNNLHTIDGPPLSQVGIFMSPSFTYAAWIKKTGNSIDDIGMIMDTDRLFSFGFERYHNRLVASLGWDNTPGMNCLAYWDNEVKLESPNDIPNDEWHHAALTYNYQTKEAKLYLDGAVVDSAISVDSVDPWCYWRHAAFTVGHGIGEYGGGGAERGFRGDIDEVRVYNYALSQAEITNISQCPANCVPENHFCNNYNPCCPPAICLANFCTVLTPSPTPTPTIKNLMGISGYVLTNYGTYGTLLDAIVMDNSGTAEFFSESVPLGANGRPSFPSPRVWSGPGYLPAVCPQCVGHGSVVALHGYVVPEGTYGTLLDAIVMDNSGTAEFFHEDVPIGTNGRPSFPSPRVWSGPDYLPAVCPQCVGP